MALLDMGGEYHCYASDVTCSYPVNGEYTDDQKSIYECVLAAQIAVITKLRPGVSWVGEYDYHLRDNSGKHCHMFMSFRFDPYNYYLKYPTLFCIFCITTCRHAPCGRT